MVLVGSDFAGSGVVVADGAGTADDADANTDSGGALFHRWWRWWRVACPGPGRRGGFLLLLLLLFLVPVGVVVAVVLVVGVGVVVGGVVVVVVGVVVVLGGVGGGLWR